MKSIKAPNVTRREFTKSAVATAVSAVLARSSWSRPPHGFAKGASSPTKNYVGANLQPPSYYSSEIPFINLVKMASNDLANAAGYSCWKTSPAEAGGSDAYIAMNSDGYPTSMTPTATTSANGGNPYTSLFTYMCKSFGTYGGGLAPGQTSYYPAGNYTLQFAGIASMTVSGDAATTTLNNTTGTLQSVTFNVTPSNNGIQLTINSVGATPPSQLAIVLTANMTAYTAGAIFNPLFITMMQNVGFSRARFMEWSQVWNSCKLIVFTGDVPSGAESATLNSTPFPNGWDLRTGYFPVQFRGGDIRQVLFTTGSSSCSWSTPTTYDNPYSNTYTGQAWTPHINQWSARPLQSNACWTTRFGVPVETRVALCTTLGIDYWHNSFMMAETGVMLDGAGNYDTQEATLIKSLLGGTSTNITVESQNEIFNSQVTQSNDYANAMGQYLFPTQSSAQQAGQEYYGVLVAKLANVWYSVWGATEFNAQVTVSMGIQFSGAGGAYQANYAMTAPDWVALGGTAPYLAPIKKLHVAPYFGAIPSSGDQATILAQSDGGLSMMFGLMYSNVYSGTTISSISSSGFVGGCISGINTEIAALESYSWYSGVTLDYYEIGAKFVGATGSFLTLLVNMTRDSRWKYVWYDPTHQLSSNAGYLPMLQTTNPNTGNIHYDVNESGAYGIYGLFESIMQPLTSGSMPPAAQGATNYVAA